MFFLIFASIYRKLPYNPNIFVVLLPGWLAYCPLNSCMSLGFRLQPAFHVCHRTFFVTVQQLGPAALMVEGLGKVGVQFDGFVKQFDGFGQLFSG